MPRRQTLTLLGLIFIGGLASYLLQNTSSIGRNVGAASFVREVLDDETSPQVAMGDADLTVVIFTDYQCPVCRRVAPAMRAALARDGNTRTVYKEWPVFGERSERAARIALAADRQGIFPSVHNALLESPFLSEAALRAAVEGAGGNWQQIQADLVIHGPAIEDQLDQTRRQAFSLGLAGTPSYLIGPFLIEGALTERDFRRAFQQARREK